LSWFSISTTNEQKNSGHLLGALFLDCGGKRSAAPLYSLPLRSPITCLAIPQNYPARLIDLAFSCEAGQRKAVWRYASPPHSKNAAVIEETGAITAPRN